LDSHIGNIIFLPISVIPELYIGIVDSQDHPASFVDLLGHEIQKQMSNKESFSLLLGKMEHIS
jgi:hypothetical protein